MSQLFETPPNPNHEDNAMSALRAQVRALTHRYQGLPLVDLYSRANAGDRVAVFVLRHLRR
jgi:hypothetical protein